MGELLNRAFLWLSAQTFKVIHDCWLLFYGLATTKLFSNQTIRNITNNLYIIVSVVILFAFSVKLIEAIVNPDLLTDAKKGVTGVLKRTIIGLLLLVAVPSIFSVAYIIQYEVITNSLVEKLILGYSDSDSANGMEGAGNTLTSSIITGMVVPIDENGVQLTHSLVCGETPNCNYPDQLLSLNADYEPYLSFLGDNPDYEHLASLNIGAEWDNGEPIYKVQAFFMLVVAVFILYQIFTLCMDTALRLVNLGVLEMIAPVIIVGYMGGGTDYLSKWAKMTFEKFMSVFLRIAGIAFMVLGFSLINDPDSIFNNQSATIWFKILVIIGLLRLIKELPNIIGKIFGVEMKGPAGIKGRLGEMAGIGNMAQKAWSGMGGLAKAGAHGLNYAATEGKKAIARKMGFSDKTLGERISESKAGRFGKVIGAAYKGGSKDGKKAASDKYKELFKPEIAGHLEHADELNKKNLNKKLKKITGGQLELDGDDKIDFKATARGIRKIGENEKMNKALISGYAGRYLDKEKRDAMEGHVEKTLKAKNAQMELDAKQGVTSTIQGLMSAFNGTQKSMASDLIRDINSGSLTSDQIMKRFNDIGAAEGKDRGNNALTVDQLKSTAQELKNRIDIAGNGTLTTDTTLLEQAKVETSQKLEKSSADMKKIEETLIGEAKDRFKTTMDIIGKSADALDNYQRETQSSYASGGKEYIIGDREGTRTGGTTATTSTQGTQSGGQNNQSGGQGGAQNSQSGGQNSSNGSYSEPVEPTQQESQGRPGGSTVHNEVPAGMAGTSETPQSTPQTSPYQGDFWQRNTGRNPDGSAYVVTPEPVTQVVQQTVQQQVQQPVQQQVQQQVQQPVQQPSNNGPVDINGSVNISGGSVDAKVDLSSVEKAVRDVERAVGENANTVSGAVRSTASDIAQAINNSTEQERKNTSTLNQNLKDINKTAKATNDKIDKNKPED